MTRTAASEAPTTTTDGVISGRFDFSAEVIMGGGQAARDAWTVACRHMEAEWSGDLDGTMATMTRNAPFQIMHATGLHVVGWDEVRQFYASRFRTFDGQGFFAHRWVVADKAIVGSGYFSGAPEGVFFGIKARGLQLCLPMTVWFYLEDGLVKGEAAYLDGHELRRQIEHGTDRDRHQPVY